MSGGLLFGGGYIWNFTVFRKLYNRFGACSVHYDFISSLSKTFLLLGTRNMRSNQKITRIKDFLSGQKVFYLDRKSFLELNIRIL